jgi:enoyl-CoA hydratase/carnithine racemase
MSGVKSASATGAESVRYEIHSGVARIQLSAPDSGNALDRQMVEAITASVDRANSDETCRVIVISASGSDFCKGMDFEAFLDGSSDIRARGEAYAQCLSSISNSAKPVIACVEGNVTGGGVGLAAACDMVLALDRTVFTLPEVLIGMIPAVITPFLMRRMSAARVKYLTLSSRPLDANEAKTFGLVDEVVSGDMDDVLNMQLRRLFCSSPAALSEAKGYFNRLHGDDLQREIRIALDQFESWVAQPQVREGVRTFAEGFAPPWFQKYKGRSDGR